MKTSELTGHALDWAVAKCEGFNPGVLTVADQVAEHEAIMRPHYNDEEWAEHLIGYNKYVLPTLRPSLVNVQPDGFKDQKPIFADGRGYPFAFSTNWSQGGPIIEREGINLQQFKGHPCRAFKGTVVHYEFSMFAPEGKPLIAAMRCFVASRLGDEVEIPEEMK